MSLSRRSVILALGSTPLLTRGVFSQSAVKVRRAGLLSSGAPLTDNSEVVVGLTAGFSKRGYVVGRSLLFERRAAEAQPERLPGHYFGKLTHAAARCKSIFGSADIVAVV